MIYILYVWQKKQPLDDLVCWLNPLWVPWASRSRRSSSSGLKKKHQKHQCETSWKLEILHSYKSPKRRVGGWPNPFKKYARQNGFIFPNFRGKNHKCLSCHHPEDIKISRGKKTPTLIKKKPHHETEHWHSEQEDHGSSKSSSDSFPRKQHQGFPWRVKQREAPRFTSQIAWKNTTSDFMFF